MMLRIDRPTDLLVRLYGDAEQHLQLLVERAIASGALGSARYRTAQLAHVHQALSDLQQQAIPHATAVIGDSYHLGVEIAEQANLAAAFTGIHHDAVNVLADAMSTKLNAAAETVGRRVDDLFRKEGLKATAHGLITGSGGSETAARLTTELAQQGVSSFVDKAGRDWGLRSYANMVARTTTREAVTQGTINRLAENGVDLVTISDDGSDDDECAPYKGNTFSLTGTTDGYDTLDQYPPFHPNCVHVLTPASANFDELAAAVA